MNSPKHNEKAGASKSDALFAKYSKQIEECNRAAKQLEETVKIRPEQKSRIYSYRAS